ncbi:hypothetical protein P378_20700 [Desulforamulus profundi]|uniref:Uncharacterized protein n=1 Tax=Desulforamulus profundi TaxID=1383067 RepID=A0A2C6MB26_9FIRM|nr:hypothetical protein [Desulforamulus profundi]PHJ36704.1 hypothetical protein P378_20700 [Desulforamulus profundi]
MKKIFSFILTMIMILSLANFAFASSTTVSDQKMTFSPDTVVTDDNMYDVFKYMGLNPINVKKRDKPVSGVVTVRDLQNALNEAKKLPNRIVIRDDNESVSNDSTTQNITTLATSGTATVYKKATITNSLVMKYIATGKYYSNGTTKYWTSALGSDIRIDTAPTPAWWYEMKDIRKNSISVKNPSTTSSYLQLDYDYTVGYYIGVNGYGILTKEIPVSGYTRFDKTYIP